MPRATLSAEEVALYGLSCLVRGPVEDAWDVLDGPVRLALAQGWIWANAGDLERFGDRDEFAAAIEPGHPVWPAFATALAATVRESWPRLRMERAAAAMRVNTIDQAQVLVLDKTGVPDHRDGDVLVPELTVVLRYDLQDGWWISGFGRCPAEPGWPPSLGG